MQRPQLEHLIRAAGEITNQYEFVVVGSQSILGSVDAPPAESARVKLVVASFFQPITV